MPQVKPGTAKIYKALLKSKSNGAELEISPQIRNISIFENLYDPTMFCEILVEDSIDLWSTFPINGEETLELSYKTFGVDDMSIYKFDIFRMKDKKDETTDKTSIYVLQGISSESITAATLGKINTSFEAPIETIISTLLRKYIKTDKFLHVEKTKGLAPITIPNLYAFQAIDFLKNRAVSAEVPNSSFVFYENQHGFHFRTIESLLYTKRNDIGSKVFTYDMSSIFPDKEEQTRMFRTIIVLEKKDIVNTVNNITGGITNVVKNFDVITKQVEPVAFNFMKNASQIIASDQMATPFNTQEFLGNFMKVSKQAQTIFNVRDSSLQSDLLPVAMGNKIAYNKLFSTFNIEVLVYGDSTLTVGETLKLNTQENSGTTGRKGSESKISGTYLITGLRHLITPNPSPVHYTAMNLQKMGFAL
jgi:hypothetical protein